MLPYDYNEELNAAMLENNITTVKSNLKNVIHTTSFCGLCLGSERDLNELNFAQVDSRTLTQELMITQVIGEEAIHNLPSHQICDVCQIELEKVYQFVCKIKNSSTILNDYVNYMDDQIADVHDVVLANNSCNIANIVIALNEINLSAKETVVVKEEMEYDNDFAEDVEPYEEDRGFICDYCGLNFKVKSEISRHIQRIHIQKKNKKTRLRECPECKISPCVHDEYLRGIQKTRDKTMPKFKCIKCPYVARVKQYFITHINKKHLKLFSYLCEICGRSFPSETSQRMHKYQYHGKKKICEYCNGAFYNQTDLDDHTNICKAQVKKYKCKSCPLSFANKVLLTTHERNHTFQYTCEICTKRFKHESSLGRHKHFVHYLKLEPSDTQNIDTSNESARKCSICPAEFYSINDLRKHLNQHGPYEKHKCTICKRDFSTRKAFMTHCRSYPHLRRADPTLRFRYNCDYCDYSCATDVHLENHRNLYHLKVKPYNCTKCEKSFTTAMHLKYHLERHDGTFRKYQCSLCSQMLCSLSGLKKHYYRHHSKEKPVPCNMCDKKFVNKSEMENHAMRFHSEKSLPCPLCGTKFYTRPGLKGHIKNVHYKGRSVSEFLNEDLLHVFRDRRKPYVEP